MRRLLAVMASAAALGGCAQLDVSVDVMNPAYLKFAAQNAMLIEEANRLALGDFGEVDQFIAGQKDVYLTFRRQCLLQAKDRAVQIQDAGARQRFVDSVDGAITSHSLLAQVDALFEAERAGLLAEDQRTAVAIRRQWRTGETAPPIPNPDIQARLLARRTNFEAVAAGLYDYRAGQLNFCGELQVLLKDAGAVAAPIKADAQAAAAQVTQSILGDGVLLTGRKEAYFAVSAPKSAWAPTYNRAFGYAVGGGSDIAIKLNSTADFSVKGFTFDARSTANVAQKVASQSLQIIAAAYGAPMPPAKDGEASPLAPPQQDPGIALEEDTAAYRAALFHIADAILADPPRLVGAGGTQLRAAVTAAFNAQRAAWPAAPEPPAK